MIYNVAQLLVEGVGGSRRYHISADLAGWDENDPQLTHVEGSVRLIRTPKGILATGTIRFPLTQVCRRCLEPIESDAVVDFEEEFIPSIDIFTGASLPIVDSDEPELIIDEHHILDLSPVLSQYIAATAVGMGLCRPDCKGLCPVCGQNLNVSSCTCSRKPADPRLAILATLLDSPDE